MEDNSRKRLYDKLSESYNLGTFEEFDSKMGNDSSRRALYDKVTEKYNIGTFEEFNAKMGNTHKQNLDAFNTEYGSFMNDFESRDSAETKMSRAGMSSGLVVPVEGSITGEERQRYLDLHKQEEALKKAWYNSPDYLAQKDADALFLSQMRDSIDQGRLAFAQANPMVEGYNPSATRGAEADKELQMYETASRIMEDVIKLHNAPSKYDGKNAFLKFGKGSADTLSDLDFWTAGLTEIADNFGVRDVLNSVQSKLGNLNDLSEETIENILSPAEKAVLQAWALNAQEQVNRKDDLARAYQAGQSATESLGFMAEFALTGGVGKAASEGVETMAKWLGRKVLGQMDDATAATVREAGEKIAKSTVGKYGARLADALAETAGKTFVMPSTFRNISEKAAEIQEDAEGNRYLTRINDAFAKGFADSFIENLSEGGRVNAIGDLIGDVAGKIPAYKKIVDKFANSKAGELLSAFNSSGIMNTLRAGGWHGFGEEYLEEWYGNALRTITGLDKEALKDFATVDNQLITITSFLPMTIFGGTVSTAQVLSAKKGLDKKAEMLRSALLERGYDEKQADNMIDMMRGASPAEISQTLTPIVNTVALRDVNEAAALMKPVGEFAEAVRRWQAFDTKYQYQEQEQRDNLRNQMTDTLGQFWQEDENGRQIVQRGVNANGEVVYLLGKPSATEAQSGTPQQVAAITSEGRKVFVDPSAVQLEGELEMNDFLGNEIMTEKGNKEQARMIEEKERALAQVRQMSAPGTTINLGTTEAPVVGTVAQRTSDGVVIAMQDGSARQVSYEELGNYIGVNTTPLTDAQMDESEADALVADKSQREAELDQEYENLVSSETEIEEAQVEVEQAVEAATPLPTKADGSVDQTALWNNDPVRWAQWNDEQRQDGGVNSLNYINGAIAREEAAVAELTAAYNAEPDFDTRASMEQQIAANTERLQRLVNLRDGYIAQAEAAQIAAEEVAAEQVAPRIMSQMGEQVDEQYDGILRQTRIKEERVRILQEYLDKISEGSLQAFVLTSDNYADVMRKEGCSEGVIAIVGMHLEAGENIGGFTSKGKLFLMEDGLPSIEEARITYVHERQHVFNTNNPVFIKAIASIADKQMLLSWLSTFVGQRGLNPYRSLSVEQLADEVVARCMEIAYTTEDFSLDLQSRGIPSEVISIIKDINNEQREDQNLLNARRGTRRDTYADVSGTGSLREDGRNIGQVSGGILEQEAARPSGIGEEGVSPRSTGEGAEPAEVDPEALLNEDGFEVDEQNEDVRFSVRYLPTPDQREGIIDSIVAVTGRTRDEAERWLDSELSLASIVLTDQEYLDYAPDAKYKAIKDNSDYPQGTVDFNNICRKRKDFTRMYTRLQRSYPNRIFTAEDLADIRTVMSEDGLTVACGLCYVEDRRQKLGEVASAFIEDLQDGFRNYAKKGATKKANAVQFTILVNGDNYIPSIYDLITLEGSDKLYEEHRGIWDAFGAYNRARGQQTQNTFQGYAEYKREILTWSDAKVKKVNSLGGLRIFSYSDFEAHHLLDIIQIIIDCAARGVMIQGYTKVPEFARVVEKTGIKLNRSLIPLGDTGIVDGKLAYDPVEGIDINDPNFLESNDNVGNILIGINDEQIRMAMADPFIHYIIPYHARQAGNIRAKLNVGAWTNYIDTQNERKMSDGKRVEKNINIYTDVLNESITNDREFVEKYLEVCRQKEYIPKFDQFLDKDAEGNYVYTPGYYKFLVDFKLFDEAGNILPQKAVVAEFDDAFNAQVLNDYAREERETTGNQMNSTYDKIVETLDLGEPTEGEDVQFRTSEDPIDILEEARKIVEREDGVAFRVISDENYEMAQRIINNLAGDTYFRRLGGEYELGKLASNYAELADIIMAIDANKNYTPVGTALLGFFAENPEMHYPLLFNDSKLGKETSKAFAEELSKVNDPYALFFMKEAWRIHKKSLEQAGLGVKNSSTTKFNKAVDARAEEIKAAEVKGTAFNFKKQESSLDEIDAVFKQLNKDPELALLHDRVMSVARTLGVKVSFAGKRGSTAGESLGDKVSYDYKYFNTPAVSDQRKCNTITHELIHSITVYAIYLRSKAPSVLSDGMLEAVDILHDVYNQIARDPAFKGEYGVSDVYEMVAELSNAQFRDKLKEKNLFQRILDALKRLLGIDTVKEDSAYQVLSDTLNYIIDNYDQAAFDAYALYASKNKSYGRMMKIEEAPSFRITPEMDKAYMDAVEAGDMETAQRMVDEAAAAAGYTIRGDHGRVSKFTIFDRNKANPEGNWGQGFYFTNNEEDVENNYATVEGPDLENKIEREVERRINQAEMNEEFNEDGEVDEFAIRKAVESEFITSEPNIVHAAIKMNNPFVVGHGMVEIGEGGLGHYDMQETYLTAEYETDEDGEINFDKPAGTLIDLVEALNDELSGYEWVDVDAYDILDDIDGMMASQFEEKARELLSQYIDSLVNDNFEIMSSEIIRAAIEKAGFDGIVDNTVNQKFGTVRRFGRTMEGVDENTRHYIAFQSSQIKETDPVTYDNDGNVIPLSKRFNPENEDIRFRMRGENESAEEFVNSTISDFNKKYIAHASISALDPSSKEDLADFFGVSADDLTDEDVADIVAEIEKQDGRGWYNPETNKIAIFVRESVRDGKKTELVISHENIHAVNMRYPEFLALGEYLWNKVEEGSKEHKYKTEIAHRYEQDEWYDEMLAYVVSEHMQNGTIAKLEYILDLENINRLHKLLNILGYGENGPTERKRRFGDVLRERLVRKDSRSVERESGEESSGDLRFRTTEITPEVRDEMAVIAATALVNGNYMKAPNGADTNLTAEQWAMVRTKGFKAWFKDSQVIDENGEPKVVYHGTEEDFTAFDEEMIGENTDSGFYGRGFYFATTMEEAKGYGENVMDAFLSLQNPLDLNKVYAESDKWDGATADGAVRWWYGLVSLFPNDAISEVTYATIDGDDWTITDLKNRIDELSATSDTPFADASAEFGIDEDFFDMIGEEDVNLPEELTDALKANGYDGVINAGVENNEIVALYPSQIKSATDNTGEFSEEEGDIRYRINENPTEAQKEAGNYKMGHLNLDGYRITIENPKGSIRRGTDSKGNSWENTLNNDYGYIRGTEGVDGDHIDVYLSDNPSEGNVFVIDQVNPQTREFDEHKVMYGFNSAEEAREAYLANFSEGWNGLGTITEVSKDEFKKWIQSSHRKTKPFSEYKSVNAISMQSEGISEEVMTGTPTEDVVAEGVSLSPAQLASLAGDIFAALPEESRKKITDSLSGNIFGLQDAILQIPTSLAMKESWDEEDKAMADVVAAELTKMAGEMTRPFSASEGLWVLYNALNPASEYDILSQASRALVQRNLGFDPETLQIEDKGKEGVRFRTVGDAGINATASLYNRGAVNVWTRIKESFVDMNASVEKLVKAIEKRSGKAAEGFENVLMALNQQSSKGLAAMESYEQKFLEPMYDKIRDIMNKTDFKYEDIVRYVILKHGLERNEKMAQRDAKAHYQEIYDDIIAKIKGMNPAQKRTYLTNAQLRDTDAKAELARLQAVNTSVLTPDQLTQYKKDIAKAKKEATEAAEHLARAQKITTLSEQDAQDELDKIFKKIERGTDSVYKEMRKNDYSGISSMFYDQLGVNRKDYSTEEEYQAALMQAKADKYDNLGDIEGAAQMEVTLFENAVDTKDLWKSINNATKETLRQQYEANMISKDQYDNLRNMFEFYVPLRGFKDNTAEDMYTYYRRPNSTGYTKPILGAEGRKTEAESPFGWIAAMAGSAIASNVKNEAKLALYYFVANRPDNGVATLSRTWFVHTPGDVDANGKKIFRPAYPPFNEDLSTDAAKQAYEDWQEQMKDLQKQGLAYEAGQRLNLGNAVVNISDTNKPEHIVNVKVGGKDYTIVINGNPRAAQAINGDLNIEATAQDYSALFGPVLRWMSSVNTSYNPEFWITNLMRDMAFTWMAVNTKEDPAYRRKFSKNYRKAFKVIGLVAKNETGTIGSNYIEQMYQDFVKYGGVTGYTQIKDNETWEKEIEKYIKSNAPDSARLASIMKGTKDAFHAFHRFGESLEQVSRFAAFLTSREMGKSIPEAINDAKEITVNFNRKGSGKMITLEEAKYLTGRNGRPLSKPEQWAAVAFTSISPLGRRFIMFFNAAIQGLNATYKLWKKNPSRFGGWALAYTALGVMNATIHALIDDDDDYLDMPQYERRTSLMIGYNGAYLKWALPQEAKAFYALGDLAVESIMGRNPHQNVLGEAAKIVTELSPINPTEGVRAFLPSIAIPAVELVVNKDYKGDPIYNDQKWLSEEEKKRTARWSKAYSGTGKIYVGIAKGLNALTGGDEYDAGLINLQPEKIQHIVQSAFGGTIRTADKFVTTVMAAMDPEEDVTIRQLPFLNRILTINDERFRNVHVNDVYDYYKADAEHALTLEKQYKKNKDKDALNDLRESDEYQWAKIYQKYKKPLEKIQEKIKVAEGTAERKDLMKQQDQLKKDMIKEISELP